MVSTGRDPNGWKCVGSKRSTSDVRSDPVIMGELERMCWQQNVRLPTSDVRTEKSCQSIQFRGERSWSWTMTMTMTMKVPGQENSPRRSFLSRVAGGRRGSLSPT
jgi:hypothetical protein